MSTATMVQEFHETYQLPVRVSPATICSKERQLRFDLLHEEMVEYTEAAWANDLVGIADALADMVYVIYGTALTYGIDLDAVLREVHRSNMTKLQNGRVLRRYDGKVLKGDSYEPPNVAAVLGL